MAVENSEVLHSNSFEDHCANTPHRHCRSTSCERFERT